MKRVKVYHKDVELPIEINEDQIPQLESNGWTTEKPLKDQPTKETENDG